MKSPHQHDFNSVKIVKVIADNSNYRIDKNGTWSLLVYCCYCGAEKAFDMLQREAAEERLEAILERG